MQKLRSKKASLPDILCAGAVEHADDHNGLGATLWLLFSLCRQKDEGLACSKNSSKIFFSDEPVGFCFISFGLLQAVPVKSAYLPIFNHQRARFRLVFANEAIRILVGNFVDNLTKHPFSFFVYLKHTVLLIIGKPLFLSMCACLLPQRTPRFLSDGMLQAIFGYFLWQVRSTLWTMWKTFCKTYFFLSAHSCSVPTLLKMRILESSILADRFPAWNRSCLRIRSTWIHSYFSNFFSGGSERMVLDKYESTAHRRVRPQCIQVLHTCWGKRIGFYRDENFGVIDYLRQIIHKFPHGAFFYRLLDRNIPTIIRLKKFGNCVTMTRLWICFKNRSMLRDGVSQQDL